jgi:CheY-like chemotaxis protein
MRQVLVVDNDRCILQVAKIILERSGFTALSADNGPEALRLLQTHNIDVLLTDMGMPAMSGAELIVEARKRQPNLSVCCMTAHVRLLDRDLERVPMLSKPFAPEQLIKTVRQISETREQRGGKMGASFFR